MLPQAVLEAALKKAMTSVSAEEKLEKTTVDGIVQLLRLYKEYGGDEERIPKKLRVIWLDEMKAKGQEE
jgi:NAD(P)H-nitrite reductase large subunit